MERLMELIPEIRKRYPSDYVGLTLEIDLYSSGRNDIVYKIYLKREWHSFRDIESLKNFVFDGNNQGEQHLFWTTPDDIINQKGEE